MLRSTVWAATLVALTIHASAGTAQAQSGTKKFKISGGGSGAYLPLDGSSVAHDATGTGTFLGAYQGVGHYRTIAFNPANLTLTFESAPTFTFTAANGHKLVCTYGKGPLGPGNAWAFPLFDGTPRVIAIFLAEFNPVGAQSTGRFAGVGGSFMMLCISQPFIPGDPSQGGTPIVYNWSGEGRLVFP